MANIEAREEEHSTENKQHQGRHVERARDDGAGIDRRGKSRTVGADVDDPVSQERKADARGDDESSSISRQLARVLESSQGSCPQ